MRKALIVLLAVLILCSCGFLWMHIYVGSYDDQVTWEETTIYGDKSEVEGVTISAANHHNRHLLWNTEETLGGELTPTTRFTFDNESISREYEYVYRGLEMYTTESIHELMNPDSQLRPVVLEKYPELIKFIRDAKVSVADMTEKFFTIDMTEYMDYYPFAGNIDLPGFYSSHFDEFQNVRNSTADDYMIQKLHEYFRIPIAGKYTIEFSINKMSYGTSSVGVSMGGYMSEGGYSPVFESIMIGEDCYFTFNAMTSDGPCDTSLIPGGYGLYQLHYSVSEDNNLVLGDPFITMEFSLDPNEEFYYLDKSDDEKYIYLHTWQGDSLMRTIIDVETMTEVQKLELIKDDDDFYFDMCQYDDFLVILLQSINRKEPMKNSIMVFEEDEQGRYHHVFTTPMNNASLKVDDDLLIFSSVSYDMDFNGETLVVAQNQFMDDHYGYAYGENPNFYVLAYDKNGLSYAGLYNVSLAEINVDNMNYDYPCIPSYYEDAITVRWN